MRIVITGASSGLGRALALYYAQTMGHAASLCLMGRNSERLAQTATDCARFGAHTHSAAVEATDKQAMAAQLIQWDDERPIDLVIANAGISAGSGGLEGETPEQAEHIFRTNVDGVFNSIHPLIPRMKARQRGQLALVSSLAGFRGMPSAPAYSASKGVLRLYAEGLRGDLARHGIKVSAVCPGFVRTPMTDVNTFPMPFLLEPEDAAKRIALGLARNKGRIVFPWPLYAVVWLLMVLPEAVSGWILSRAPKKNGA